jgi:glycosyltransferase involved in cell wall biosynthesis
MDPLIVVGRFPPPLDGQSLLTRWFGEMMQSDFQIVTIDTNMPSDSSALEKIRRYRLAGKRLREALTTYPEAVIVWQSISPRTLGHLRDWLTILPHVHGRTVVAVCHQRFGPVFDRLLTRQSAVRMIGRLSKIVFNDRFLEAECAEWIPGSTSAIIPNSLANERICDRENVLRRIKEGTSTSIQVLFLSNMIKEKGYLTLLEAGQILNDRDIPFQINYVGRWYSKADKTNFEKEVIRLGLSEHVVHHGPVSDDTRIRELHLAADVFALPTYYPTEASPVSIVEALSAGTPIITTGQGGIPEMVRDGIESIVVERRNPDGIAAAIERLREPALWSSLAHSARSRFETHYHPDIVRSKWMNLLDEVNPSDG